MKYSDFRLGPPQGPFQSPQQRFKCKRNALFLDRVHFRVNFRVLNRGSSAYQGPFHSQQSRNTVFLDRILARVNFRGSTWLNRGSNSGFQKDPPQSQFQSPPQSPRQSPRQNPPEVISESTTESTTETTPESISESPRSPLQSLLQCPFQDSVKSPLQSSPQLYLLVDC